MTQAGADRVLAMDLHAHQIQGFFSIPMDHLYAAPVMIDYFKKLDIPNLTVVSPDVGGIKMARAYAKRLSADLAICDKRRNGPMDTDVVHIIGEVSGRNVLLVDDMIATGTSIVTGAAACRKNGAQDVYICATHPVLAGHAIDKLRTAEVKEIVVTDSIPIRDGVLSDLKVLSVADLVGEAIRRIHKSESVSSLFL